jgi:hypothetical protein
MDTEPRSMQIVPASALGACPRMIMSAWHWNRFHIDAKCNCGRLCGFTDAAGGPCVLLVDKHKTDREGHLRHDDGKRAQRDVWIR